MFVLINLLTFDIKCGQEYTYNSISLWETYFIPLGYEMYFYSPTYLALSDKCEHDLFRITIHNGDKLMGFSYEYQILNHEYEPLRIHHFPIKPNTWVLVQNSPHSGEMLYVLITHHQKSQKFVLIKTWKSQVFLDFAYDEETDSIKIFNLNLSDRWNLFETIKLNE